MMVSFLCTQVCMNYNGSQSESITQLATDVPTGEGREINLQPETNMHINPLSPIDVYRRHLDPMHL